MDPTKLRVAWLPETYQCVFAFYLRKRLKKMTDFHQVKAVFSIEEVQRDSLVLTDGTNFKRSAYGTISYLPAAFGGVCASVVIRELLGLNVELVKRPAGIKVKKSPAPSTKRAGELSLV